MRNADAKYRHLVYTSRIVRHCPHSRYVSYVRPKDLKMTPARRHVKTQKRFFLFFLPHSNVKHADEPRFLFKLFRRYELLRDTENCDLTPRNIYSSKRKPV